LLEKSSGKINMKFAAVMLLGLLLSGCSMDVAKTHPAHQLKFQSIRTSGINQVKIVSTHSLFPGDILLSSSTSLTSLGIRLFSFSGVSHASLYVGDNQIAEAVGKGVKIITLEEAIAESNNLLVLRKQDLSPAQSLLIREYALAHLGEKYNYKGIVMFTPFMATRRVCELPFPGTSARDGCLRALATVQLSAEMPGADSEASNSFFCSQFVISAFMAAGAPLFSGEAQWISPADLLHMRNGDVASYQIPQKLDYVGHLKRWNLADILSFRKSAE